MRSRANFSLRGYLSQFIKFESYKVEIFNRILFTNLQGNQFVGKFFSIVKSDSGKGSNALGESKILLERFNCTRGNIKIESWRCKRCIVAIAGFGCSE